MRGIDGADIAARGRVVKDGETHTTKTGANMGAVTIAVAVERDRDGKRGTPWRLGVLGFGNKADAVAELQKGDAVSVCGRLRRRRWMQNGVERERWSVLVETLHLSPEDCQRSLEIAAEREREVKAREEAQDERERSTDFRRQRAELEADKEEHRREAADERLRQREAELAKWQAQVERQAKANAADGELLKRWEARLKAEDAKIKARLEELAKREADAQQAIEDADAAAKAVREQEAAKLKAAQEHSEATLRRTRRRDTQSRLAHHILKRCRNADMTDPGDQAIVDEFEADFSAAIEPSTPAAKLRELAAKHHFRLEGSRAKRAAPDKTTATERDANAVDFPER